MSTESEVKNMASRIRDALDMSLQKEKLSIQREQVELHDKRLFEESGVKELFEALYEEKVMEDEMWIELKNENVWGGRVRDNLYLGWNHFGRRMCIYSHVLDGVLYVCGEHRLRVNNPFLTGEDPIDLETAVKKALQNPGRFYGSRT